jgi:hypothetical protein
MSEIDLENELDDLQGGRNVSRSQKNSATDADGGSEQNGGESDQPESFLKKLFAEFNLFDSLLLVSFLLITLSTLYLIYAMSNSYGGWPWDKPWDVKL